MNNNVSKQVLLSVIGVAILVIAVIGVSFALYVEMNYDSAESAGYEKVVYDNEAKEIMLTNPVPVSMEQGKNSSNVVSFSLTGTSKRYEIKVVPGDNDKTKDRLKDNEVYAYISTEDVEGVTFTATGNFGTTGQALGSSEVTLGSGYFATNNKDYRNFTVHFWVDESTGANTENTYYSAKVIVELPRNK